MSLFDDDQTLEDAVDELVLSNLPPQFSKPGNPIGTTAALVGPTETLCLVHDSLVAYFNQAPKTPDLLKLGVDKVVIAKVNEIIFEGLLARLKQDRLGDPRRRFKS